MFRFGICHFDLWRIFSVFHSVKNIWLSWYYCIRNRFIPCYYLLLLFIQKGCFNKLISWGQWSIHRTLFSKKWKALYWHFERKNKIMSNYPNDNEVFCRFLLKTNWTLKPTYNKSLAKVAGLCSADSLLVAESSVIRINPPAGGWWNSRAAKSRQKLEAIL